MGENSNKQAFRLTPKGALIQACAEHGLPHSAGESIWQTLEAFCVRRLQDVDPEASYTAIIFDGDGGDVIGAERNDF